MTPSQADMLLHTLSGPRRNHYATGDNDPDMAELVAEGLMIEVDRPGFLPDGDHVFMATEAGKVEAGREQLRRRLAAPKLTRSQQRYRLWLRVSDAFNCSFGEWLRRGWYRECA
jgi:NADPH-dependent ferric siderophore reductase